MSNKNNLNNINNQPVQDGQNAGAEARVNDSQNGRGNNPNAGGRGGRKRARRSFNNKNVIVKPFINSQDVNVATRVVIDPKRCNNPMVGVEVHSPHGFIVECFDKVRRKYEMKAYMKSKDEQMFHGSSMISELCTLLECGEIAYCAASATTTVDILCENRKLFMTGPNGKLLVDEDMFELLNSFMPVDNCVQLNIYHVVYVIHRVRNAILGSDCYAVTIKPEAAVLDYELINAMLMDASENNPLLKAIIAELNNQSSIVVRSEEDKDVIARYCPYYTYRIEGSTANVIPEISPCVHDKMSEYQHEFKHYHWKLVNPQYAVVSESQNMYAERVDPKLTSMLARVRATLFFTQPKVKLADELMLCPEARMPYVVSPIAYVQDESVYKEFCGQVQHYRMTEEEEKHMSNELKAMFMKVNDLSAGPVTEVKVQQPRKSMARNEELKPSLELKVSKPRVGSGQGHLVLVDGVKYFISRSVFSALERKDKTKLAIQKKYLAHAIKLTDTKAQGVLELSSAREQTLLRWFKKKEFDSTETF